MPGVFSGERAMEVHSQVDANQSRYPLPAATASYRQGGGSTAGEGASGEGTSSQDGGRMEDWYSESDLDMTEVGPPVLPATREAPAVELGAGTGGVQKATPRNLWSSPGRPISVASTPAVTEATVTTAITFPRLWGDLCGTWRFPISSPHCKMDSRGPSRGI